MKKNTTDLNTFLHDKNLPDFHKLVSVCPPTQTICGDNKTNTNNENELDSDDNDVSEESEDDSYGDNIFPCGDNVGLCFEGDLSTINEFDDKFEELD